ncbi:MAG: hypothetical protein C0616_02430 [Desulfuromonas sp.]|nr:MAG: hypothetical protein C0616_02430 [Desulfuromonas sp.]
MRSLFLIPFMILIATGAFGAELVSKIAAVVNQEIITTYQLEQELDKMLVDRGALSQPQKEQARRQLLNRLIEESLLRQKIEEVGLRVSDEEVDDAIRDVRVQNKITEDQLKEAVREQGLSFDDYREKLRQQILRLKLVNREVQSKVDITLQDVREYFREHIDDYREPATVRLNYLMLPDTSASGGKGLDELQAEAAELYQRLQQGENFSSLVEELEQSGRAQGGELGTFKEAELTTEVRQALSELEVGSFSSPVTTAAGIMLVRVEERKSGGFRKFDEVRREIERLLQDQDRDERFRQWSKQLKETAYIDIRI